ncbi:MAG: LysR family transcriptional regulator [Pseudomonadota bacterium]
MLSTAHRYVLSVAETGSIRASSQALNVAASAISRQIQLVEHQFGYPLFERFASGMVLTPEGQILAQHLKRTAREVELAQAEINALHGLVTGTIRFAAIEGVLASWLIPAMALFRAQHPGITFEGQILGSQAAYDLVMPTVWISAWWSMAKTGRASTFENATTHRFWRRCARIIRWRIPPPSRWTPWRRSR